MQKFELVLKNEKEKTYRTISQLLVLLNAIGIIYPIAIGPKDFKNLWLPLLSLAMTFFYFLFVVVERIAKKPSPDDLHRYVFFFFSSAWIAVGLWWISLLLLMFIILDILVHRKLILTITDRFIRLPTVPKKIVQWNELNNAILKDGIITIDFKNNKLFQYPILNSDWDVNEETFNQFCKLRLASSG
jgi:hypothetical protein